MVEVSNLKIYTKHNEILKDISFTSNKNLAILGSSGSGKSTLCRAICSLLPKNLTISYESMKTDKKPAYIFQDCISVFYPYYKIKDTIKLILPEKISITKDMLKKLGVSDNAWEMYPFELSRGMASRVQIAINLAFDAEILLLDEITSSLDEANRGIIIDLLLGLNLQKIVITHDEDLAFKLCDEVLVLESSQMKYFGDKMGYFV